VISAGLFHFIGNAAIIMSSMKKLFPDAGGACFCKSFPVDLESVVKWGDFPEDIQDNVFSPRLVGAYGAAALCGGNVDLDPICPHVRHLLLWLYLFTSGSQE